MNGLTEGRIVHYVSEDASGHCRAAIVVRVFDNSGLANLTVFPDWSNDGNKDGLVWKTSRQYSPDASEVYKWHWPQECSR